MPKLLKEVEPGDLITAEFMNKIVAAIDSLDERLVNIGSATQDKKSVRIEAIIPGGPYRMGQTVSVLGDNFQYSKGGHRVTVNGTAVNSFVPGSTDEKLVFKLPAIKGLTKAGKAVRLEVKNLVSTAYWPIVMVAGEQVIEGAVDVVYKGVKPSKIAANKAAAFRYELVSRATVGASYLITPTVKVSSNQTAWDKQLQVFDIAGNLVTGKPMRLDPGAPVEIIVAITKVPTKPKKFTLTVEAGANGVSGVDQRDFTVGQTAPQEDETITLTYNACTIYNALGQEVGPLDDYYVKARQTLVLPMGYRALFKMHAVFTRVGGYNLACKLVSPLKNWTAERNTQQTPAAYKVSEHDLDADGTLAKDLQFYVYPKTGATASGKVQFVIKEKSTPNPRTWTLNVKVRS
jgi:hypothetical protein